MSEMAIEPKNKLNIKVGLLAVVIGIIVFMFITYWNIFEEYRIEILKLQIKATENINEKAKNNLKLYQNKKITLKKYYEYNDEDKKFELNFYNIFRKEAYERYLVDFIVLYIPILVMFILTTITSFCLVKNKLRKILRFIYYLIPLCGLSYIWYYWNINTAYIYTAYCLILMVLLYLYYWITNYLVKKYMMVKAETKEQ